MSTDLYLSYIHTHLTHVHTSICDCISFSVLAYFYSCITNVLILKILLSRCMYEENVRYAQLRSNILIYKLWKNKLSPGDTLFINKSKIRLGIKREKEKRN